MTSSALVICVQTIALHILRPSVCDEITTGYFLGPLGVKRLKLEYRERIAGVIGYCRIAYERQVPFDSGFRMDDDSLYCLELTEKAFRSEGLALSEPIRIGDWEYLASSPRPPC